MLIIINKGSSTHVLPNVTKHGIRSTIVGFFHEGDTERVDQVLWFFVADRKKGFGVHLSQWDNIFILHDDLLAPEHRGQMTNLEWIKQA